MEQLSQVEREFLRMMADGWDLGREFWSHGPYLLQQNGIGRDGDLLQAEATLVDALRDRGLIRSCGYQFLMEKFTLSALGKQVVEQQLWDEMLRKGY